MRALSLLFFFLFVTSLQAQVADDDRSNWNMNDYWEDTRLEFKNLVYGAFNQESCSSSAKNLLGCVAAVNKMRQFQSPGSLVMVKLDLKGNNKFYEEDFSNISKERYDELYENYLISLKKELEEMEDALALVPLNIEKEVSRFEREHVEAANDSMIAGELYNEYLRVAVDPHTYLIPKAYMQDSSRPSVSKKGIGIYFNLVNHESRLKYLITDVIEGSPAEKAGILPGDIILSANKADSQEEVYEAIKIADPIEFTMLRGEGLVEIFLQKGQYTVKQVQGSVLRQDGNKYGYIKLRTFSDNTACATMKKLAAKMIAEDQIEGFILDLRNNGGGLVSQAQCIMSMYLEPLSISWAVRYLEDAGTSMGPDTIITSKNYYGDQEFKDLHTVTLINGYSASASEAVAMYLKDYRKSFIVGERSFGKGSMQTLVDYENNEKVLNGKTIALYYGPKGISPQVRGVDPDFTVYPSIEQTEASPFQREADLYTFPILDKEVDISRYIEQDRLEELEIIESCLGESRLNTRFADLGPVEKFLFDNQLETAMEVLKCANSHVDIYRGRELKRVDSYTYKDQWDLMGEILEKMKEEVEKNMPPLELEFEDPYGPIEIPPLPPLPEVPLPKKR